MDGKYATVQLLIESLHSKNGLLDWKCYPQKNGKVVIRMEFKDGGQNVNKSDESEMELKQEPEVIPDNLSPRDKHNFLRAKSYRESNPRKRPRSSQSDTPETFRISENCADPGPSLLDSHVCLSVESLTRAVSDSFNSAHSESAVSRDEQAKDLTIETTNPALDSGHDLLDPPIENENLYTSVDSNILPTPFDDVDSLYDPDENMYHPYDPETNEKDRRPCRDADCYYAEEPFEKWTLRLKRNMYTCTLCGRKICDWCTWAFRRHLVHLKHFRNYSFDLPEGRPVDVKQLMQGLY